MIQGTQVIPHLEILGCKNGDFKKSNLVFYKQIFVFTLLTKFLINVRNNQSQKTVLYLIFSYRDNRSSLSSSNKWCPGIKTLDLFCRIASIFSGSISVLKIEKITGLNKNIHNEFLMLNSHHCHLINQRYSRAHPRASNF